MKYFDIWLDNTYLRTCTACNRQEALIIAKSMFGDDVIVIEVKE